MPLHTQRFYTQNLLYTDAFTHTHRHKRFYTQTLLHTDAFTHAQTLLHADPFGHPFSQFSVAEIIPTLRHGDAAVPRGAVVGLRVAAATDAVSGGFVEVAGDHQVLVGDI